MKKIISLLLVVLLCLPASLIVASADGAYTVTTADGANTSSDGYINIIKYLDCYDGGDVINIPEQYITVGQWKANIKNPSINANGLADTDYITDACTLTLTYDDSAEKTVSINTNEYNYQYKFFDKSTEPVTNSTYKLSSNLQLTSGGSQGAITPSTVMNPDGSYSMRVSISNMVETATNRYAQFNQALAGINENIDDPYIVSADISLSGGSQTKLVFALMYGSSQRVPVDIASSGSAIMAKLSSGTPVNLKIHVFPKSNRADIYLDGELVVKNHNLISSDAEYKDYNNIFVRAYVNTKVDGVYKETSITISDYSINYGYGRCDAEIYVPTVLSINNYGEETSAKPEELEPIEVSINKDGYTKAALYIDGYKTEETNVIGRTAVLPIDSIGLGRHKVEVRMYPESGDYASKEIIVDVSDVILQDSYIEDFENFEVGDTPSNHSLASGVTSSFLHLQYENVEVDEDNSNNNILHVTSETVTTGTSRNELTLNTARDGIYSLRFKYDRFVESDVSFIELVQNADASKGLSRTIAAIVRISGNTLKASNSSFAALELGKWYTIEFESFCSNNIMNLYLYDDTGALVSSLLGMAVSGIKAVNTYRIYTPYITTDADKSADMYLDDISFTPVLYTGSITDITASTANPYTVSADIENVSSVDKVEITNIAGDVSVMLNEFDTASGRLDVTLNQPLTGGMRYNIKVYADGISYPMTSSFTASGEYVFVNDYRFAYSGGTDSVVLNIDNTYTVDKDVKVIISTYNGQSVENVRAVNITAQPGEKEYQVQITEDLSKVRIFPILSYSKPTAIYGGGIITK